MSVTWQQYQYGSALTLGSLLCPAVHSATQAHCSAFSTQIILPWPTRPQRREPKFKVTRGFRPLPVLSPEQVAPGSWCHTLCRVWVGEAWGGSWAELVAGGGQEKNVFIEHSKIKGRIKPQMLRIIAPRARIQEISCTVLSMRIPRILAKLFLSLEPLSISYFSWKTYIWVLHSENRWPCGHPDTLTPSVSQPQDSNSRESDSRNLPKAT